MCTGMENIKIALNNPVQAFLEKVNESEKAVDSKLLYRPIQNSDIVPVPLSVDILLKKKNMLYREPDSIQSERVYEMKKLVKDTTLP